MRNLFSKHKTRFRKALLITCPLVVTYFMLMSMMSWAQQTDHDLVIKLDERLSSHIGEFQGIQTTVARNTTTIAVINETVGGLVKRMDTMVYAVWGLVVMIAGQFLHKYLEEKKNNDNL